MSTLVLRSFVENNIALTADTTQTEPGAAVALSILVVALVLAYGAAARVVEPVAKAIKSLLWLALAAFFMLLAIGVGVSLAVTHLG